jgi:hypothetical protein
MNRAAPGGTRTGRECRRALPVGGGSFDPMLRALVACSIAVTCAACERDHASREAGATTDIELTDIAGAPPLRLSVPRVDGPHPWQLIGPDFLMAGSLADGFSAEIAIRVKREDLGDCFPPPHGTMSGEPKPCKGEQWADKDGFRSQRCLEKDGVDVTAELQRGGVTLCCRATWTRSAAPSESLERMAAGVEAACTSLRPR